MADLCGVLMGRIAMGPDVGHSRLTGWGRRMRLLPRIRRRWIQRRRIRQRWRRLLVGGQGARLDGFGHPRKVGRGGVWGSEALILKNVGQLVECLGLRVTQLTEGDGGYGMLEGMDQVAGSGEGGVGG
jgi:hypothetical protein